MFTIAVDFDNTLITRLESGDYVPVRGAAEAMQRLRAKGCRIVIYTCRTGLARKERTLDKEVEFIQEILAFHEIPFDEVFLGEKLVADLYIDDRAIPFRGNWDRTIRETETNIDNLAKMMDEEELIG